MAMTIETVRALCKAKIKAEIDAREEDGKIADDGGLDFGSNVDDAFECGADRGEINGASNLACEILTIIGDGDG